MNDIWAFAGNERRIPVKQGLVQYFVNYNMKNGWYTGTQPIITTNWKEDGPNRWLVPFGWSVGRITRLGALPINAQVGRLLQSHPPKIPALSEMAGPCAHSTTLSKGTVIGQNHAQRGCLWRVTPNRTAYPMLLRRG